MPTWNSIQTLLVNSKLKLHATGTPQKPLSNLSIQTDICNNLKKDAKKHVDEPTQILDLVRDEERKEMDYVLWLWEESSKR